MTEALAGLSVTQASVGGLASSSPAQAGWGVSLTDLSSFDQSMQGAIARVEAQQAVQPSPAAEAMVRPLEHLDAEASRLSVDASAAAKQGKEMSPAEVVQLTFRCHEFLFHTQLTSNAANRTSDGLQQLFKQQ